jgi:hypothetical protein
MAVDMLMGKKPDRAIIKGELIRLLEGLEFYRAWQISLVKHRKGVVTQEDLNEIVEPASVFLEEFESAKGSQYLYVLRDVQQWYAHTASDLSFLSNQDALCAEAVHAFLIAFRTEIGFDFFKEADVLRKIATQVLKAGKIKSSGDYYCLVELENDLSQTVLTAEEMTQISRLLRTYEGQFETG